MLPTSNHNNNNRHRRGGNNNRSNNNPRSDSPAYGSNDRKKEIRSFLANISNEDKNLMFESLLRTNGEIVEDEGIKSQQQIASPNDDNNYNNGHYYYQEESYDDIATNNDNQYISCDEEAVGNNTL